MAKRNKNKNKNKNSERSKRQTSIGRPGSGNDGNSSSGSSGASNAGDQRRGQNSTQIESKKKNSGGGGGSKKVREAGERIKDSLKVQEKKGKDTADKYKDKKPKSVKNIGSKNQDGYKKRSDTNDRINDLRGNSKNNQTGLAKGKNNGKSNDLGWTKTKNTKSGAGINKSGKATSPTGGNRKGVQVGGAKGRGKASKAPGPLKDGMLIDAKESLGPLSNEYTQTFKELGRLKDINTQLSGALDDLKLENKANMDAFANQEARNQRMMADLQLGTANTIESLKGDMAADRDAYNASLSALQETYGNQEAMAERMAQLQELQAKKSANLGRAYVPGMEKSLATVQYGDNRRRRRRDKDNRLSDLRLNTGLNQVAATATAGLQLA